MQDIKRDELYTAAKYATPVSDNTGYIYLRPNLVVFSEDKCYVLTPNIQKFGIQSVDTQPWWMEDFDFERILSDEYFQIRQYPWMPYSSTDQNMWVDKPSSWEDLHDAKFNCWDSLGATASIEQYDFKSDTYQDIDDFFVNRDYHSNQEKGSTWFYFNKPLTVPVCLVDVINQLRENTKSASKGLVNNVVNQVKQKITPDITKKPTSQPGGKNKTKQNYPDGNKLLQLASEDSCINLTAEPTIGDNYPVERFHDSVGDDPTLPKQKKKERKPGVNFFRDPKTTKDFYAAWLEGPGGFVPGYNVEMNPGMYSDQFNSVQTQDHLAAQDDCIYVTADINKEAKIVKRKDGYHVLSEKGKHLGGPYTKEKAEERLRQIEFFKHNK